MASGLSVNVMGARLGDLGGQEQREAEGALEGGLPILEHVLSSHAWQFGHN
jgi:hypothetical protein